MIRRPPRSTHCISSAASDVYKRQPLKDINELHCIFLIIIGLSMNGNMNGKQSFLNSYEELRFIGCGKSGSVYLVKHKMKQELYVAKKISLEGLSDKRVESAFSEVKTSPTLRPKCCRVSSTRTSYHTRAAT
eukprot:TRINITY_DN9133_c0_g2_i4.p1 TRINITY_DN9133_c0_g2~~TRINITY_DN9133_c0_g2_i4.p1  ORF type:complete len:155 (+),score=60.02 TRINITY_DN9133_c0_g2_i4:70-465(+)